MTRPGIYTDVVPHPLGGFVHATLGTDWRTVTVEWVRTTGQRSLVWSHLLPSKCLYFRVGVSPAGEVIVVGQDGREGTSQDGALWILTAGKTESIDGRGFGQYVAVVEWVNTAFVVYATRRHDYLSALVSATGDVGTWVAGPLPQGLTSAGQGWLDVIGGQLIWTDLARLWPSAQDHKLTCPMTRNGVTVGQAPGTRDGLRAYGPDLSSELTTEAVFEARVAYDPVSGRYAVCARMLNFRSFFELCPPWPAIVALPVSVAPFSRPCWLLPFHATRHNKSVVSPGHAEIITDGQDAGVRVSARPVIVDMASEPSADDVLALFVVIGRDDMARAWAVANRRGVPIMAYWDHITDIQVSPVLRPGWDWLSVMLYCDPAETIESFRRRAHGQVSSASGRGFSLVLTVQMFDRNGKELNQEKLSEMQGLWRELAEAYPDVIGLAPFAVIRGDRGQNGVTGYPFLGEWLSAYAAAMTAPARPVKTSPPTEGPEMQIPADVMALIEEFASVYPIPHGDGSEAWVDEALRNGWTKKMQEQVCFRFGPDWGSKARDSGEHTPRTKEAIAWNKNGLHVWDPLIGAGSGRPTLTRDPEYFFVPDQHFIPVDPVDHLNRVVSSGVVRPALPFMAAKSSFDWHIHRDMAWLDRMKEEGPVRTLRLVVHSVYRESGKVTPEEAIRRLRLGLEILQAEGFTAAVTFHADTKERGDTKDDIIARTVQINDVVKDFAGSVVIAARLWNENSHPGEQWFACDPDFLVELDRLVDARIPLAHGAGHGGEDINVIVAGGSWIAHHADRKKTPEENAAIMAAAQVRFGKSVVDDEPIGFEAAAQPDRRVSDLAWARRQAQAAIDAGLGGSTYHCNAGIWADVSMLDDVQREAGRIFSQTVGGIVIPPIVVPPTGEAVTPEQIAAVVRGGFFQDIAKFIGVTGTEDEKRPAVSAWMLARILVINQIYLDVFGRPCDLEGYGSCVTAILEQDLTDDELRVEKQKAYARGDR